jgi:DNA-binding NtrC family response regulator
VSKSESNKTKKEKVTAGTEKSKLSSLLYITDQPESFESMRDTLTECSYTVSICPHDNNVFPYVKKKNIKTILLDTPSADENELELLKKIKDFDPIIEVIILCQPNASEKVAEFIGLGASDVIFKPVDNDELLSALKIIEDKRALRRETFLLEKELEEKYLFNNMVGKNPRMLDIFNLITRVAKYPISILLTGETGTGKGMLAKRIHTLSPRSDKKLITCDCPTIPENLFESELFGYVKGAFTGAQKTKKGLLEDAHNSTIFFDEIGDMPVFMQSKLLRILEDHKFRRLGSNQDIEVDIRVISATNMNIREAIKEGRFREELFHRINAVSITLPTLKERQDDIPLLARYFLNKYNKKFSKSIAGISNRVKKLLLSYDWPGNVRELEKAKEYSVALCSKKFIDIIDLPPYLKDLSLDKQKEEPLDLKNFPSLEDLEKQHIIKALELTHRNKIQASRILGISRYSLYRKLKSFNITD